MPNLIRCRRRIAPSAAASTAIHVKTATVPTRVARRNLDHSWILFIYESDKWLRRTRNLPWHRVLGPIDEQQIEPVLYTGPVLELVLAQLTSFRFVSRVIPPHLLHAFDDGFWIVRYKHRAFGKRSA